MPREVRRSERHASGMQTLRSLRVRRSFASLTQEELARLAGLNPATVWRAEHGHAISPRAARRIADVLGCHPAELMLEPEQ